MFLDLGESSKLLIAEVVTSGISGSKTSHDKVISAICVIILIVASNRLSASANRRETGRCRFSRKELADVISISSWYRSWVVMFIRQLRNSRLQRHCRFLEGVLALNDKRSVRGRLSINLSSGLK